jgi:glycosyltransferase involved in cell wall biosynthesis
VRLAIYENLPPGGALRTSYEIGLRLVRKGHEIDLYRLSTYTEKGPFDLAPHGVTTHVAPYRPLWGTLDGRFHDGHLAPRSYTLFGPLKRLHRRLAAEISSRGYDAVLLHPDAMTYAPYMLRWLTGVPTVYYCQEPPRVAVERAVRQQHRSNLASASHGIGLARILEDSLVLGRLAAEDSRSAGHATVIAVNSIYSRERAWAAYARNAVVCYLGIDPELFKPAAQEPARRREVLVVGSLTGAKNHELVVDSLGLLPVETRPALRIVTPRPGGTESLERRAHAKGVQLAIDVSLSETALIERYQQALATICAARLEPFGLTAIESMACGTPVVAVREAGFRETVVDEVTGILVEPESAALAEGIGRLVADTTAVPKMGKAGRDEVVRRWTWDRTVTQLEQILEGARNR